MTNKERKADNAARKAAIFKQTAAYRIARAMNSAQPYPTHQEQRVAHQTTDRASHREQRREQAVMTNSLRVQNYRALDYGNTPINELLTEAQWRGLLDLFGHRCAYCGRKSNQLTIDHIISQSQGGKHVLANVVPSCLKCNSAKQAKTPEEWITYMYAIRKQQPTQANTAWIIRLCHNSDTFRQSLQSVMGVDEGPPEEVAQAFVEWVQAHARTRTS
jgi:5-methylcytosine-specific restriction endonuclease McrA